MELLGRYPLINKYGEEDYYKNRWEDDVKSGIICVLAAGILLLLSIWHNLALYFSGSDEINYYVYILMILRGSGIVFSLLLLIWLIINRHDPKIICYEWSIFFWDLTLVVTAIYANFINLQLSYVGSNASIPIIMFLYILVPQHNGLLRIIPSLLFSGSLIVIYHFYGRPPDPLDLWVLYVGIIFANLMGAYFADRMYYKDYLFYCLSNRDELTGVYNRRYLEKRLQKEWNTCYEAQESISGCLIDIDFFKHFNDTYGHLFGDDILRKVSAELMKNLEEPDAFLARYGGEEFIVILKGRSKEECLVFAEKICKAIEKLQIVHRASNVSLYLTLSIGIANVVPQAGMKNEDLIRQADIALYKAKDKGRNKVIAYWE